MMREEMLEKIIKKLPDKDVSIIPLTKESVHKLKWVEKNKEFRFDGKLYDFVKIKHQADTDYVYCINDKQEEQLIASLNDHLQKDYDYQMPHAKRIASLQAKQSKDYVNSEYSVKILKIEREFVYPSPTENMTFFYSEIVTPPPKINI
jgi:hypothetical protein